MLFFFPDLYPDELWYSVLCRYHLRTGNKKVQTTIGELFMGSNAAVMGNLFPTNSIKSVVDQLPKETIDIKDVILNHTLFPYITRIYPINRKNEMIEKLMKGKLEAQTAIWRSIKEIKELRACPYCIKEDKERYGESYWHVNHQIPNIKICQKHKCYLRKYILRDSKQLNEKFIYPDQCDKKVESVYMKKDDTLSDSNEYAAAEQDIKIADTLIQYQTMPIEMCPTEGYNNLYQELINQGYVKKIANHDFSIDIDKLYDYLDLFFGEKEVENVFGNRRSCVIWKMKNWKIYSPNKYAYLSIFLNQDPYETFGPCSKSDKYLKILLKLKDEHVMYSKKYVAEQLSVGPTTLDIIADMYKIEPFWHTINNDSQKTEMIKLYLSPEEKDRIVSSAEQMHYKSVSIFIKDIINDYLQKQEKTL